MLLLNFILGIEKRPTFFVGSRYGRSSTNTRTSSTGTIQSLKSRRIIIAPRNDHFYIGSRYGKRSAWSLPPYEQIKLDLAVSKETGHKEVEHILSFSSIMLASITSCTYLARERVLDEGEDENDDDDDDDEEKQENLASPPIPVFSLPPTSTAD
ncbi:RYamide neuropeptides [Drosophila eugracilis]|uniref:RYamide neuropeptides n=1 Tax=Drosophila eugracilis TaxID=29029 RepID=UPI001BDA46F0|nr:RYamide neuropeptides [Drosophila eugracilis]